MAPGWNGRAAGGGGMMAPLTTLGAILRFSYYFLIFSFTSIQTR
jgi:hypothetical protein